MASDAPGPQDPGCFSELLLYSTEVGKLGPVLRLLPLSLSAGYKALLETGMQVPWGEWLVYSEDVLAGHG